MKLASIYLITTLLLLTACNSTDEESVSKIAKRFVVHTQMCQYDKAAALCTDNGKEDVAWMASNITESDLEAMRLADKGMTAYCDEVEVNESTALAIVSIENGLANDSLSHTGIITDFQMQLELVKVGTKWKVDNVK